MKRAKTLYSLISSYCGIARMTILLAGVTASIATVAYFLSASDIQAAEAASATPPVSLVKLDVPAEALINEEFTFSLTFSNTPGTAAGFAPFVDLVLDSGGVDDNTPLPSSGSAGPCDGVSFISARMAGANSGPIQLPTTPATPLAANCGTSNVSLPHPFGAAFGPVPVPNGGQLVTLELPFGSFQPGQPEIRIEVRARIHDHADLHQPLSISARGGFRYGSGSLATNLPQLSQTIQATVKPVLLKLEKKYLGPEGETASGPNFPRKYEIIVDIANGQTVNNLQIADTISPNMQLIGLVGPTTAGCATTGTPPPTLTVTCSPTIIGVLGPDVKVTFSFFVPRLRSGGPLPVLSAIGCTNAPVPDVALVKVKWRPNDPRDDADNTPSNGIDQVVESATAKDTLIAKRFTIRKSPAQVVGGGALAPGKTVRYTLDIEVSDFFRIGRIVVEDFLTDGQQFIPGGPMSPKLSVMDRYGTINNLPFPTSTVTETPNVPSACGIKREPQDLIFPATATKVRFDISSAMASSGALPFLSAGMITGGHVPTPSLIGAKASIVFFAKITDTYFLSELSGKPLVKEDPVCNRATISANIFTNHPTSPTMTSFRCSDDTAVAALLPSDTLSKKVWAKNGSTSGVNSSTQFVAGDTITFKITKVIPTGDYAQMKIKDWVPLPKLNMSGMNPSIGSCTGNGIPAANTICRTPSDNLPPPTNTLTPLPHENGFLIDYGSGNDPANGPKTVDLLFTLKVTNDPMADNLLLTNQVQECETNSFGNAQFCQMDLAQFIVREPKLVIRKGVTWTSNPHAQFSQQGLCSSAGCESALPSGNNISYLGLGIGGVVNSSKLAAGFFNSNLGNVDANDDVTYVITVENQGGAAAYDVRIDDLIPNNMIPVTARWLTGTGIGLPNIFLPSPGFPLNIASIPAYHPSNGSNILVITLTGKLKSNVIPECQDNVAMIKKYTSQAGSSNDFVTAGFTAPFQDAATVCIGPKPTKSIVSTSEAHTTPDNSSNGGIPNVAIGEIVRYRLTTQVPEGGMINNFRVSDSIPSGLKYLNDGTARLAFVSNGGLSVGSLVPAVYKMPGDETTVLDLSPNGAPLQPITPQAPLPLGCGDDANFNLESIQNTETDPNQELIVIEFNAIVCNVLGNQDSPQTVLGNTYSVRWDSSQPVTSNSANVNVVEPKVTVKKTPTVFGGNIGSTVTFSITATNSGTADAFEVVIADVPTGMSIVGITVPNMSPPGCATNETIGTTSVSYRRFNAGCTIQIEVKARVNACPIENTASSKYTSLPRNGTTPNSTGSTAGTPASDTGERDGSGGGSSATTLNNYVDPSRVVGRCEVVTGRPGTLEVVKKVNSFQPFSPPAGVTFEINVNCSPTGPVEDITLATNQIKTYNSVPAGSVCTVTERPPAPPPGNPVCPSFVWDPPVFDPPGGSVTVAPGSTNRITVTNTFRCSTQNSSRGTQLIF